MHRLLIAAVLVVSLFVPVLRAQQKKTAPPRPTPTAADLAYGTHERQVLDFWKAKSDVPTPLVLYIHGGGWQGGDKLSLHGAAIQQYLDAGISVAAINYRYVKQAAALKIEPPVKAPLEDAARALQLIRSKAGEWNLDKNRVGATGGSAGACSSLWLAFHDDLADPKSADPVARESTRLYCAAVNGAQTSLDPKDLREWMPNYSYGGHAFGFATFQSFYEGREKVLEWLKQYSPIEHVTKDDPPIFMDYPSQKVPPVLGEKQTDPTHSAILGLKLAEKLKAANVEVVLVYPGQSHPQYKNAAQFLIERLKAADDSRRKSGFAPLFNGKDLTGWREKTGGVSLDSKTEAYQGRFRVKDQTIRIDPKVKGDVRIMTVRAFPGDVHIRFEYNPGPGCNNDLFLRGQKFDLKTPDVKNLQEGEWNTFEIIVQGARIEFKNNGEVQRTAKVKGAGTALELRAEYGPVQFRRMRVREGS